MLESLLSIGAGAGWRPLQITHGALKSFVDNDFKRPKGLERAHQYHRRDTINKLINAQWEGDDWLDWYQDRDYTVLATREENRDESSFKKLAKKDIPPEKSLFRGKRVGYVYGEAEKEFLRNAACELGFV